MERISDRDRLECYISKYNMDEIFSKDMKEYMEVFKYNKNEYICREGEKLKYLLFFVEGKAKVYSSLSNGKSLLLCFYKPFMVIGDVEFIDIDTANSNVQALDEACCIAIDMEIIRQLCIEDAKFLKYMCHCLREKLMRLGKYSSINLLYPLENRLASYILAVTSRSSNEDGTDIIFDGNLSEVAELLGTSYRHLLRTLNNLCGQSVIKKIPGGYEVVHLCKLQALAGDLYE